MGMKVYLDCKGACLTLDPMYRRVSYQADIGGREKFISFICDRVEGVKDERFIPDNLMFRFDNPDRELRGKIFNDVVGENYIKQLSDELHRQGVMPTDCVRLRDAAFCLEHGIDPLSAEGRHDSLLKNPTFQQEAERYGSGVHVIRNGLALFPTMTVIQTPLGLLLFSNASTVFDWMQKFADSFFERGRKAGQMHLWDVAPLDRTFLQKADLALTADVKRPPADALLPEYILGGGIRRATFDTAPT